ncbi:CRISPR-associated endonuclease Cas3'' [Frankia sp. B2]|uniref:CRISPR-associated endonuclease Cas3'' n=1 Tax=Frankia sp. B2 TaxID=2541730 RepID=UPI001F118BAF|nr:CRISPR-associated endonuclease Cas3'' [Frankia sp. B2]
MHLLLGHLLDTAAVGELVWDRFLASTIRDRLDDCSDGRGRSLFALLCGLHDVGKATPAFQMKDEGLAQRVRAAGLGWRGVTPQQGRQWHHARAGAVIVQRAFVDRVAGDLNVDLASFSELRTPSRGGQLQGSGEVAQRHSW